jgi:NAD(P)-dependent dehydrogenase (short-subunit alcohol dehydrogenase family)
MTSTNLRSVAVTGAGSGLGRELALGLAARNYRVFGTAASEAEILDLKEASDGSVELRRCDITKAGSVTQWVRSVTEQTGGRLDLLISNAGILSPGPVEIVPLDEMRREFEVNVFGALSVINAFLPALREARGRIVQISTAGARFPLPFNGASGASKSAIETLATVYRSELKPFGISVVIVAPGGMRTTGSVTTAKTIQRVSEAMSAEERALYGARFDQYARVFNSMGSEGLDPTDAASRIIAIAEQVPAPSFATVGDDSAELLRIVREKSEEEQDAYRLRMFGLDRDQFELK